MTLTQKQDPIAFSSQLIDRKINRFFPVILTKKSLAQNATRRQTAFLDLSVDLPNRLFSWILDSYHHQIGQTTGRPAHWRPLGPVPLSITSKYNDDFPSPSPHSPSPAQTRHEPLFRVSKIHDQIQASAIIYPLKSAWQLPQVFRPLRDGLLAYPQCFCRLPRRQKVFLDVIAALVTNHPSPRFLLQKLKPPTAPVQDTHQASFKQSRLGREIFFPRPVELQVVACYIGQDSHLKLNITEAVLGQPMRGGFQYNVSLPRRHNFRQPLPQDIRVR